MALITCVESPGAVPLADDGLEGIMSRIQLVDVDKLRRYEQTDPRKVSEIEQSLRSTGILINPVMVDIERQLLIDGHHRARAFQLLGLSKIPAFTVDYFSSDLTVKGWSHATEASTKEIELALDRLDSPPGGSWTVVTAGSHGEVLATRAFGDSWESSHDLHEWALGVEDMGNPTMLHTELEALRLELCHGYIDPVVDKHAVIEMVDQGKLFSREVNRHLVDERPLDVCIPLESSQDEAGLRRHLDRVSQDRLPLAVEPGFRQGGRLYEERITLFRTHRGHS